MTDLKFTDEDNKAVEGDFRILTIVPETALSMQLELSSFGNGSFDITWSRLVLNIV